MAERKAVNKYYPPDWDPRKGSANKRVGQHPLRDRARKLSQGILVIRFELPYNIWCGGCGNHVGMGVRYNAEKSKVGNYYSTPIYKFRMKCHLCDNYFEIQTDPKNHDYVILSGARRKEQRWDPVANEQVVPEDKSTQKKLATDPMYKLEHGSDDQQKGKQKVMSLAQIEESRISMLDDYILNRMARDKFRTEKKQIKEAAEADRAILERASLNIDLVEESEEDKKLAVLMKYSVTSSFEDKQKEKRKSIEQRPIFNAGDTILPSSSSSSSSPDQVHKPAMSGSGGDFKQKLGRVLQSTYKDPFKFVRKRNGKNASSSILPNRSQLGIRLKSSKTAASMSSKLLHKKNTDNPGSVYKLYNLSKSAESSSSGKACYIKSVNTPSDTAFLDSVTESKYHHNLPGSKSSEAFKNQNESLTSSDSLNAENKSDYSPLTEQLKFSNTEKDSNDNNEQTRRSEEVLNNKVAVNNDNNVSSINNTGLQTLMCSYTDSDSEPGV